MVATAVTQMAAQLAPPALLGFATLLSRVAGFTKMQTAALCLVVVASPVAWHLNEARAVEKEGRRVSRVTAAAAAAAPASRQTLRMVSLRKRT